MTICLALVCESGKSLVAVADRMVSVESLSLEFEQGARKIEQIGEGFAALTAGDALAHTDLLDDAREKVSGLHQPSVREVAGAVEECFARHRQNLAEKLVLRRIGLDYQSFLEQQQTLSDVLVMGLSTEYRAVELGVELLVGGVDLSGAHLYGISDPGIAECYDSIGYAAIGSGLPHAEGFLTEADYSPQISLNRGIWLAYVAKKRSERAPGVGSRFTDILTIDTAGRISFLNSVVLGKLDSVYQAYSQNLTAAYHSVQQAIDEIALEYEIPEGGEADG
jgi:20S proteasome alpha/beta subunit